MTIDATRTLQIRGSRWRLVLLALLGVGMTAIGVALVVPEVFGRNGDIPVRAFGTVGALFFGACTGVAFWRLVTADRVVITLSPQGVRDTRVAAEVIPWTGVRGLSTWSSHGQKVLVVDVDPAVEAKLSLTAMARWTRGANRALGADGLCIAAQGLDVSYAELLAAATAYCEAAQVPFSPRV